jgi:DNA-binding transcriptional MerR regulator
MPQTSPNRYPQPQSAYLLPVRFIRLVLGAKFHSKRSIVPHYTIRQLAEEFNLTLRTLRFWENRDLLSPERAGKERSYSERDRKTLAQIVQWRQQQFTVEEIKSALARGGFTTDELRRQLAFLLEARRGVDQAIADIERKISA